MSKADESYREVCFRAHGRECHLCEDDEDVIAHHRDGDRDNNSVSNLLPVCRSCHALIHWGRIDGLSEELPTPSRADLPNGPDDVMRPNIRLSYTTDGLVKDYANRNDLSTSEAYREIIERGLNELEAEEE